MPDDALLYQAYGSMLLWLQGAIKPTTEARAVSFLRTAIRLDGTQGVAHYQLGRLALRQGKTEEALQELESAARLDPKSPRVHYVLVTAYRKLGRPKDAEKELAVYQNLKAEESQSASLRPLAFNAIRSSMAPPGPIEADISTLHKPDILTLQRQNLQKTSKRAVTENLKVNSLRIKSELP